MEDERKDYYKYLSRLSKHEISFSEVGDYIVSQFFTQDNSNFEVANKLNGVITFEEAKQNYDSSPKNQFTVDYIRNEKIKIVQ